MLYMKEMRAKVVAECTLKESAAINQILGRRVSVSHTQQGQSIMRNGSRLSQLLRPQIAVLSVVEKHCLFTFLFLYNCNLAQCCKSKSTTPWEGEILIAVVGPLMGKLPCCLSLKYQWSLSLSVMAAVLMDVCVFLYVQWHALSREEQAKYYELARKERQLHMQLYPGWSARDNYVSF